MPELKISINEKTYGALLTMVENSGETIPTVLDRAIENYRRSLFLKQANSAFASLRQNEALWEEELAERQLWEQTLNDGIEE
jgi:hypothetical protein